MWNPKTLEYSKVSNEGLSRWSGCRRAKIRASFDLLLTADNFLAMLLKTSTFG